jgi:hypothetical protein
VVDILYCDTLTAPDNAAHNRFVTSPRVLVVASERSEVLAHRLSHAFNQAGFSCRPIIEGQTFDATINQEALGGLAKDWTAIFNYYDVLGAVRSLVRSHEIYVFLSGTTLTTSRDDLAFLRDLGKQLVFVFDVVPEGKPGEAIAAIRAAEQYGDVVFGTQTALRFAIRPHLNLSDATDPEACSEIIKRILARLDTPPERWDTYPTSFVTEFSLDDDVSLDPAILTATTEIVQRWGLPQDVHVRALIERRLMSDAAWDETRPAVRWRPDSTVVDRTLFALDWLSRGAKQQAGQILHECVCLLESDPTVLTDPDVALAMGRLARELEQGSLAVDLWTIAAQAEPNRDDVNKAVIAMAGKPGEMTK